MIPAQDQRIKPVAGDAGVIVGPCCGEGEVGAVGENSRIGSGGGGGAGERFGSIQRTVMTDGVVVNRTLSQGHPRRAVDGQPRVQPGLFET